MCGIAGFSLRNGSRVNARRLAHELLSSIEDRGTHASGFAYINGTEIGVYKDAKPGGNLPLHELPRRAKSVILHTRYATQGKPEFNENNHPVVSPGRSIALVHNGVISNDFHFREEFGGEFADLPRVDSSVIPALIERYGVESVEKLEGYAAISWLDVRQEQRQTMHLARLDYSPVAYTWLLDGSFVYASTEALLMRALNKSGYAYGGVFEMDEGDYFQVLNGIVIERETGLEMQEDWWTRRKYAASTAGGHATTTGSESGTTTILGYNQYGIGSSFGTAEGVVDDIPELSPEEEEKLMSWEEDYRARQCTSKDAAMALLPESNSDEDLQGFYITIEDGAIEALESTEQLEQRLQWYSNMGLWDNAAFPDAPQNLRWTNFIVDVGHISVKDGMVSWLEDLAEIDQHESAAVYNLDNVRDGLGMLIAAAA